MNELTKYIAIDKYKQIVWSHSLENIMKILTRDYGEVFLEELITEKKIQIYRRIDNVKPSYILRIWNALCKGLEAYGNSVSRCHPDHLFWF